MTLTHQGIIGSLPPLPRHLCLAEYREEPVTQIRLILNTRRLTAISLSEYHSVVNFILTWYTMLAPLYRKNLVSSTLHVDDNWDPDTNDHAFWIEVVLHLTSLEHA